MIMIDKSVLLFPVVTLICLASGIKAESPAVPWSITVESSNGSYLLVLRSPYFKKQEEHARRLRELWSKGGIPPENVAAARRALQEKLNLEESIRNTYPKSGLYTRGASPRLLWYIDLYDTDSWYLVSNDGKHLVVGKYRIHGIKDERGIPGNPLVKEVVRSSPDMNQVILTFYSLGEPLRSFKASELLDVEDLQETSSNDFSWNSGYALVETQYQFNVKKISGEELVFDITTANRTNQVVPGQQNSNSMPDTGSSFCGGIVLLVLFAVSLSFGR